MFDYYAMPADWPGRTEATVQAWSQRASIVERLIHQDIAAEMGGSFNPKYFIPYVQLHEFEALAFADVDILAAVLAPVTKYPKQLLAQKFRGILNGAGHPEAINDGYETCPSRRISSVVPGYKKRFFGPIVTSLIGMAALRARCTHFGSWLCRLEQL